MESERENILQRLRAGLPALKREFPLHGLALFGSMARGDTLAGSDIDILADVEPSIGLDFVTLADKLEELTGHKIDLVSRRAIKPRLWKEIERELIDV
jgi:predicted nucleotidyltransferase